MVALMWTNVFDSEKKKNCFYKCGKFVKGVVGRSPKVFNGKYYLPLEGTGDKMVAFIYKFLDIALSFHLISSP